MPISETWLLPDGVADVLPEQAQIIEKLRRKALDFLVSRGYQLVYTPFIEYIESLSSLSEANQDLDLATFKVIDQLTGRLLGIRADMTPQVARIDAHVRPVWLVIATQVLSCILNLRVLVPPVHRCNWVPSFLVQKV